MICVISIARPAAPQGVVHLRRVASHLQTDENFDVAGVAAGLGGGKTTLTQRQRELRPLLFQLTARAVLVRQALPKRRIQAQAVAHFRRRSTAGCDVEGGGTLSATVKSNVPPSARSTADGNIRGLPLLAQTQLFAEREAPATGRPNRLAAGHSPLAEAGQRLPLPQVIASRTSRRANDARATASTLRSVLLDRGRRWRTELAAVEHGVVALLAFLETYRGGEHVGAALGLLEFVHPPIRDLTGLTGILRAASVGSVDERNALHLVAIILRIRPSDADGECRPLVIQGKSLRHVLRIAAVGERGHVFRPAGADHDRRAIIPVDGAGQRAPMGPTAS